MTTVDRQAFLVLEPVWDTEATVDEAIAATGADTGSMTLRQVGNRMTATLQAQRELLALPDRLLQRLPADVQVRLVLDMGDADIDSLVGATELADELRQVGRPAVAAMATTDFVDAVGGAPPDDYRRTTVETRFADVPAYLRTVTVAGLKPAILSLAIAPDAVHAVTGHPDGQVRRWDLTTGDQLAEDVTRHAAFVRALAHARDGALLSGGSDGVRRTPGNRVWLAGTEVTALAVHPDGDRFVVGDSTGAIFVLDMSGSVAGMTQDEPVIALAAASKTIFTDSGATIRRWTWGGESGGPPLTGHRSYIRTLAARDTLLVSGGYDRNIILWDTATGEETRRIETDSEVKCLVISPDGRQIISGHADGSVRRWDTGGSLVASHSGHTGSVSAVALAEDGRTIVSGGADGLLRRWPLWSSELISEQLAEVASDLESAVDSLGVGGDVHTIATVLAAASTQPPLSVALLGDWGAGKSSFMRQLRDRIDLLTRSTAQVGTRKAFVSQVRQVSFNAWHYSDDHLWVGLIEQIFRELRAAPPSAADPSRVRLLEERLAGEDAERDRLDEELVTVRRMDGRFGRLFAPLLSWPVFRAAVRGLWSRRFLVGLLVLVAGIAVVFLGQHLLGGVIAVLGPAVAVWSGVGQYVATARAQLVARKEDLEREIAATTEELDELDPARRLDRLLAEITAEDRYAGFRGLTGRIHHDLRRLSADLAAARTRSSDGTPPLQRIVLYVDDLDRCTPARVVDVLQAVNLLLTMDLFMVVVAVDPRWLLRSLERHHSGLFGDDVGPVVYLDKIFHIPFALRPMGDRAVNYLHSLLPDVELADDPSPAPVVERSEARGLSTPPPRSASIEALPQEHVAATPVATAEGLRITAAEREFLSRLVPLLTTPRAVKKLTNLYRLLRLSVPRAELSEFLDGQYQVAALLLASSPSNVRAILEHKPADVDALATDLNIDQPPAVYQRWAAEVARYGFTTYDLYGG